MNLVSLTLLCEWVVLITSIAPVVFPRLSWTKRHPTLGLWLWFSALGSAALSTLIALLGLTSLIWQTWLRLHAATDSKHFWAEFGLSFIPWLVLAAFGISISLLNLRLERAVTTVKQIDQMLAVGAVLQAGGWYLLPVPARAAFVARINGRFEVVITAGVIAALSDNQFAAVLAHERAHLRSGHHWLKWIAATGAGLLPQLVAGQFLLTETARLCEYAADSAAMRSGVARGTLISALELLGGEAEVDRRERLLAVA